MWRSVVLGSLVLSVSNIASAQSLFSAVDPAPETGSVVAAAPEVQSNPITGFIEFLFGDAGRQSQRGQQWFVAPSAETCPRVASECAMQTSSIFTSA
jgi:hypothetical protein